MLCLVIALVFKGMLVSLFFSAKWHISNDNKVIFNGIEINLPFSWWVVYKDGERIQLTKIPYFRQEHFGYLFITRKLLTQDELLKFKKEKIVKEDRLIKKGLDALNINNILAYSIEYRIDDPPEKRDLIYWTLSVPSESLVVSAIHIYPEDKETIMNDILRKIKLQREP